MRVGSDRCVALLRGKGDDDSSRQGLAFPAKLHGRRAPARRGSDRPALPTPLMSLLTGPERLDCLDQLRRIHSSSRHRPDGRTVAVLDLDLAIVQGAIVHDHDSGILLQDEHSPVPQLHMNFYNRFRQCCNRHCANQDCGSRAARLRRTHRPLVLNTRRRDFTHLFDLVIRDIPLYLHFPFRALHWTRSKSLNRRHDSRRG